MSILCEAGLGYVVEQRGLLHAVPGPGLQPTARALPHPPPAPHPVRHASGLRA